MAARPSWALSSRTSPKCWLKEVALVRFVTRDSYRRGSDGARVSKLHAEWQKSFEAVPQWQEKGYEKPKFHQGEHLEEALDQFGPFRAFWCMPWEAFLQVLKRMFEISNWKTAPYTVCKHWATKSVMHYRDPARESWYAAGVQCACSVLG